MKNPILVLPDVRYKESYLSGLRELQQEGRRPEFNAEEIEKDFEKHLDVFRDEAAGKNLKEGRVQSAMYWLVDYGTYLGSVRIAPALNEKLATVGGNIGYEIRPTERKKGYGTLILKLALQKAEEMGLQKVLLTCDVTNEGSRKIIEGNGGVFESTVPNPEIPNIDRARFWVDLRNRRRSARVK